MRRYETVFIIDPDASADQRTAVLERINSEIEKYQGVLLQHDEWGLRKMAYPVRKKPRGYYILTDYCGNGQIVSEIERFFKIDDSVMKYMTVQTAEDVDPEQAKAEIAEAKTKAPVEVDEETAAAPDAASAETVAIPSAAETVAIPSAEAVEAQAAEEAKAGEAEVASDINAEVADLETADRIKEDE